MKVMKTQTAAFSQMFGADSHRIINEQKIHQFLPKTIKLTTKLTSYYANLPQLNLSPATNVTHCLPLSESEVGMGIKTAGVDKSVCVKFQLEKECQFGDHVFIVGDDPIMGSWNPSNAMPFHWSEGHVWSVLLVLPADKQIQYKVLLKKSTGEILWQPGPDRSFQAWETKNVITVSEEWDNVEARLISEEQQVIEEDEELMHETLVEPSVQNLPEAPIKEHAPTMNSSVLKFDENASADTAEDKNGDHLKKNPSSSGVNSQSSDRDQRNEVSLREGIEKQANADKHAAEVEDAGNLVTENEGPVLVPGLTLLVSSSEEDFP